METLKGIIKSLNDKKKFGFIKCGGNEYFFHREDFQGYWDDLVNDFEAFNKKKIEVEFEEVYSPKGPRASNVKRLDWPNQAA